jgi:gliding motility-associated-like protein
MVCINTPYRNYGFNILPYNSVGIYTHEQHRQSVNGCDSLITLTLRVPEVGVEIVSSNPDFCETYETVLSAITPNPTIHWSTGATTPDITVNRSGTYTVIVSENNCKASNSYTIAKCPVAIVFPNAITPINQDGINDYFYLPAANAVYDFSIFIHSRWGECIFSSNDPHFRWDGTVKGKIMQGVYVYTVIYRDKNDRLSKEITGIITVY